MQITIFSGFSKEHNSTKQPSGGTVVNCYLKDDTSLINPVFVLDSANFSVNYVQWGSRYYFVDDVVSIRNSTVELHCSVDAMASWKSLIGASSQYVTRSASQYNPRVIDALYPCKAGETIDVTTLSNLDSDFFDKDGCYVVGVVGQGGVESGITYYAFNNLLGDDFGAFVDYLFQGNYLDAPTTEVSLELQKELVNPFQYVVSCMWFPMALSGSLEDVKFGYWTATGVKGMKLSGKGTIARAYTSGAVSLPRHPQQASLGQFVNGAPYTEHTLTVYTFGDIEIPAEYTVQSGTIYVNLYVDIITGVGMLTVANDEQYAFLRTFGQVGVQVQLSQLTTPFITSAIAGKASQLSPMFEGVKSAEGLDIGNIFGSIAGIGDGLKAKGSRVNSMGSFGTRIAYNYPARVTTSFREVVNTDPEHNGRPLMQRVTISSLSGFIKVENPDVDIPATTQEKDIIANYMRSGFYYE